MSIHYIEGTELQKIVDVIKNKNKIETFEGSEIPKLIKNEFLLKMLFDGSEEHVEIIDEVTAEDLEGLTYMRSYTFYAVYWLKKITLPEGMTNISNNIFNSCTNLEEVILPSTLDSFGKNTFASCYKLRSINVDYIINVSSGMFQKCYELNNLDFPKLKSIISYGFHTCKALDTLIIRTNSVCSLGHIDAFTDTPIAKGTGFVYVPSALIEDYKTATNWATYAAQFRAIEDYPEICGGVSE